MMMFFHDVVVAVVVVADFFRVMGSTMILLYW